MNKTTKILRNRVAIAFDFDDTLAPDTFDLLIKDLDLDPKTFREERYDPLKQDGWDGIPARFHALSQAANSHDDPSKRFTKEYLQNFGQQLQLFPGVTDLFDNLRKQVKEISSDVEIEFYLITSGFVEIARACSIADQFTAMWGCDLHYDENGVAAGVKHTITHAEKTRYLYYLSRGIESHSENDLLFVYEDVSPEQLHIPLDQVIYVGDGTSDLPCFRVMNQERGIAFGVYPEGSAQDWKQQYSVSPGQRISALAPANYEEGSMLVRALEFAVASICRSIQIKQLNANS